MAACRMSWASCSARSMSTVEGWAAALSAGAGSGPGDSGIERHEATRAMDRIRGGLRSRGVISIFPGYGARAVRGLTVGLVDRDGEGRAPRSRALLSVRARLQALRPRSGAAKSFRCLPLVVGAACGMVPGAIPAPGEGGGWIAPPAVAPGVVSRSTRP